MMRSNSAVTTLACMLTRTKDSHCVTQAFTSYLLENEWFRSPLSTLLLLLVLKLMFFDRIQQGFEHLSTNFIDFTSRFFVLLFDLWNVSLGGLGYFLKHAFCSICSELNFMWIVLSSYCRVARGLAMNYYNDVEEKPFRQRK